MIKMSIVLKRNPEEIQQEFISYHIPQVNELISFGKFIVDKYRVLEVTHQIVRDDRRDINGERNTDNYLNVVLICEIE